MSEQAGIDPSNKEIAASAQLLQLVAYTLLATAALLLVAGGLALYYLGVQGLSFLPMVAMVALAEIVGAIFLRRRAQAMLRDLPVAGD